LLFLLSLAAVPASAAEVQFDGFYRARFRAFDTLSLDRANPLEEGLAAYAQHRFFLEPRLLVSDRAGLFLQIKGLDNVPWGSAPIPADPNLPDNPNLFEYDLASPTSESDAQAPLLDLTLWRAWGEVYTPIGEFSFGRMPLHWGLGLWQNDGLTVEPDFADYGDTTDRAMWELLVQDQFYLRATVDVPAEQLLNQQDDTTALGFGVAYRTEDLTAGILLQLDHTGNQQPAGGALNVFTADAAADVTLGKLNVAAEAIGQFGGGDITAVLNDVEVALENTSITAVGAALDATLDLDAFRIRARGGLATGDRQNDARNFRTFTYDRDYSVGMFLFEQPMPTLAAAAPNDVNEGRDFSQVLTGNALSNAIWFKPSVSRRIVDGLWVDASYLGATVARAVQLEGVDQSRGYGNEIQLGVRYDGIEHFHVDGRAALFLPGTVYSVSQTDGTTRTGFDDPAFGFQLTGRVEF
jgi:hypothetical protein